MAWSAVCASTDVSELQHDPSRSEIDPGEEIATVTDQPVVSARDLRHDEDGREFLDGKLFTGIAIDYWPNGSKGSEQSYRDGIEDGLSITWHPNGVKRSETIDVAGRTEGDRREWYENGQLKREHVIDERGRTTEKEWDPNGELIRSRSW